MATDSNERKAMQAERTEDHERVIDETVMPAYRPKIEALLERVGGACREYSFTWDGRVHDLSGDDFRWSIIVYRPGDDSRDNERGIDISVQIAEALMYGDNEAHEGYGINFGLDVVEWGGLILGGLSPYNYTDEVWVDARDGEAVAERWAILEGVDVADVPALILSNQS